MDQSYFLKIFIEFRFLRPCMYIWARYGGSRIYFR